MNSNAIGIALVLLVGVGCSTDRYRWNLKHAYITPEAHLQPGDFEEIVRIVTNATPEPIINVTTPFRDKAHRGQVSVLTGYPNGTGGHEFTLEKDGSTWRMILSSELVQ